MRPTLKPTLNLATASFAAAIFLISCGPAIGETDGSDGSATSGLSASSATTGGSSSGGTGTGTTGGGSTGGETGAILPPSNNGTGGSSNPNDCAGVTTFGNSCSPNVGWCNYAQAEIGNNCVGCHGSFRTLANVKADTNIEGRITGKTMPPNSSGLPAADISKIKTWIDCGYPK